MITSGGESDAVAHLKSNQPEHRRSDYLRGLKENVIIGKLIPAGTGAARYQALEPHLPEADALPPGLGADWLASSSPPAPAAAAEASAKTRQTPPTPPNRSAPFPPQPTPS